MLVTKPHPDQKVFCPVCSWRGTVGESLVVPDDLVRCPKCHYALEKVND